MDWWRDPLGDAGAGSAGDPRRRPGGGVDADGRHAARPRRRRRARRGHRRARCRAAAGRDRSSPSTSPTTSAPMPRLRIAIARIADPPPHVVEAVEAFDPDRTRRRVRQVPHRVADAGRPAARRPPPPGVGGAGGQDDRRRPARPGRRRRGAVDRSCRSATPRRRGARLDRGRRHGVGGRRHATATTAAAPARAGSPTTTRRPRSPPSSAPHCDAVRIMPFLDGIATSIHGIVLPDGVVALRPVELVTLRRGHELRYAGCATFWDPPDGRPRRDARRRRGGSASVLRDEVDFRGAFTLDGVATVDGFRPTELNPRFGAGLGVITRGLGDVPLHARARPRRRRRRARRSPPPSWSGEILAGADARRSRRHVAARTSTTPVESTARGVATTAATWRWAGRRRAGRRRRRRRRRLRPRSRSTPTRTPVGPSVGQRGGGVLALRRRRAGHRRSAR